MGNARGNNLHWFNRHILDVNHLYLCRDRNRRRLQYGGFELLLDRNGRVKILLDGNRRVKILLDRRCNLCLYNQGIAYLY